MIFFATVGPTRLNSSRRKPERERALVSFNIAIRRPSSMPWGCGLISMISGGSSRVLRSYTASSPAGSLYRSVTCGFAIAVCLRYMSTERCPFW